MFNHRSTFLPGLNGIRAIAAFAVVYQHIVQNSFRIGLQNSLGTDLAGYGVTIFFALSGFLITYLLLLEKERFGTINVIAFYKRRILRIWPLYYLYLLLAGLVIWYWQLKPLDGNYLFYFFMAANLPYFLQTAFPLIGHYWSLGIEEQFYLFWPWIIRRSGNVMTGILVFIFGFLVLKIIAWYLMTRTGSSGFYRFMILNRFECMAIGAAGAVMFHRRTKWFLHVSFNIFIQALPWIGLLLMALNRFRFAYTFDHDLVAILTVILIVNVAANDTVIFSLKQGIFDFLGKISYGIYIYHPLVIFFCCRLIARTMGDRSADVKYLALFSTVVAGTILVAWASYEFFEKRFLVIKERYSVLAPLS